MDCSVLLYVFVFSWPAQFSTLLYTPCGFKLMTESITFIRLDYLRLFFSRKVVFAFCHRTSQQDPVGPVHTGDADEDVQLWLPGLLYSSL